MNTIAVDHDELSALLRKIAGPEGSVEERIARVARKLGWGFRRAKSHWYGDARRIEHHEIAAARDEARRREQASANAEIAELRVRLARLEAHLSVVDPHFHGPTREVVRSNLDGFRRIPDE